MSRTCQYPIDDGPPRRWCDRRATRGSYCDEHYAICYRPAREPILVRAAERGLSDAAIVARLARHVA